MSLAIEKVEVASTQLTFLGITLDTIYMEAHLPDEKIARIKQMSTLWLTKKNATNGKYHLSLDCYIMLLK